MQHNKYDEFLNKFDFINKVLDECKQKITLKQNILKEKQKTHEVIIFHIKLTK